MPPISRRTNANIERGLRKDSKKAVLNEETDEASQHNKSKPQKKRIILLLRKNAARRGFTKIRNADSSRPCTQGRGSRRSNADFQRVSASIRVMTCGFQILWEQRFSLNSVFPAGPCPFPRQPQSGDHPQREPEGLFLQKSIYPCRARGHRHPPS